MIRIRQVSAPDESLLEGLHELLADVVEGGASVGFLAPLSRQTAEKYWRQVFAALDGHHFLWVAEAGGRVVGSIQLASVERENSRHRAEVQKLFVLGSHRGQGISRGLLEAAEAFAGSIGRTLLVLYTESGSVAESVYRHLGWQRAGEIPEFALTPDGRLHTTVYYYKFNRTGP